jgi:hypothetical protein
MTTVDPPAVRSAVENLVLARLAVPSRKPPSAADVRDDVAKVTGSPLNSDEFTELTARLRAEGLVEPRPRSKGAVRLTDAGRAAALEYLGVTALPSRTNWKAVRAKYLLPKALAGADAGKLDKADKLGAFLIRREYDLSAGTTVRQALEALVCKLVGRPGETTLDGLFRAVLSDELRAEGRLPKKDLLKQFPRTISGAKSGGLDDLRTAVVAGWLRAEPGRADGRSPATGPPPEPAPLDLPEFAATVKRIARDCPPDARFGSNKVFVAAVWRESQAEDGFPRMPLADFKAALAEASREGLIRLEPADLVQAMEPKLVSDSEVIRAGAAFHFILVEEPAL